MKQSVASARTRLSRTSPSSVSKIPSSGIASVPEPSTELSRWFEMIVHSWRLPSESIGSDFATWLPRYHRPARAIPARITRITPTIRHALRQPLPWAGAGAGPWAAQLGGAPAPPAAIPAAGGAPQAPGGGAWGAGACGAGGCCAGGCCGGGVSPAGWPQPGSRGRGGFRRGCRRSGRLGGLPPAGRRCGGRGRFWRRGRRLPPAGGCPRRGGGFGRSGDGLRGRGVGRLSPAWNGARLGRLARHGRSPRWSRVPDVAHCPRSRPATQCRSRRAVLAERARETVELAGHGGVAQW